MIFPHHCLQKSGKEGLVFVQTIYPCYVGWLADFTNKLK